MKACIHLTGNLFGNKSTLHWFKAFHLSHHLFLISLLVGSLYLSTPLASQKSPSAISNSPNKGFKGHVFIIPFEMRNSQKGVEFIDNWQYLGPVEKVKQRPTRGQNQACMLIVDENDTYISAPGTRKIRPGVMIFASQKEDFYYISRVVSSKNNWFEVHNE